MDIPASRALALPAGPGGWAPPRPVFGKEARDQTMSKSATELLAHKPNELREVLECGSPPHEPKSRSRLMRSHLRKIWVQGFNARSCSENSLPLSSARCHQKQQRAAALQNLAEVR